MSLYNSKEIVENYEKYKKNLFYKLISEYSVKKLFNFNLKGKKCIDFACGTGDSCQILLDLNADEIYALDKSEEMIKKAKEIFKTETRLKFYVQDCSLPVNFGEFDVVFSFLFLNYAETKEKLNAFLKSMYNSLKSGGICAGLTINCFLKPEDFSKLYKYGMQRSLIAPHIHLTKLYDGPVQNGKYIIEFTTFVWKPEDYEESFRKVGFKNFEWIKPSLLDTYEDKENFYKDFLDFSPHILFKAIK